MIVPWVEAVGRVVKGGGKSAFLGGWEFWENFLAFRKMGVLGRLRGGKTSIAVACARRLYVEGLVRGVFSNFPINPRYIPQVRSCLNTCIILDEAAEYADARLSSSTRQRYGRYLGKMGSWLISPSVDLMDKRLAPVRLWREFDMWAVDAWLYKFLIRDSAEQGGDFLGEFLWAGYQEVFDQYDHEFIPLDDGGILDQFDVDINNYGGSMRRVLTSEDWDDYWKEKAASKVKRKLGSVLIPGQVVDG